MSEPKRAFEAAIWGMKMRFKTSEWVDVTRKCRVSCPGLDGSRAHIYDTATGKILWFLEDRGWKRGRMHMNGHSYRTHKGRIYRRKD